MSKTVYQCIYLQAFITFLLIVVVSSDSEDSEGIIIAKEPRPGWVRFCGGESRFDVFSNQCPAGFMWKSDVKVGEAEWDCICSRGSWHRSSKFCSSDDVQRFVQGDVTCFNPQKGGNAEGMLYLGDQYSAWDSGEPVFLTSYKSGFTIRRDDFDENWTLPPRKNQDAGVLIVRPRDDWTVEDKNNPDLRLCLRAPTPTFSEEIEGIYIYNVSMFFNTIKANDFKLLFTKTCFSWKKDDGKTWYEIEAENMDDKNMVVPKFDNKTANEACKRCMSVPIPESPKTDIHGQALKGPEKKTPYDLKNVAVLTSEINLQSERLGLYWTNRVLRKDADYAKGNFQELDILKKAAVLAYGTCNMNYIPKEFYQYFLVMFRKLLAESFQKYAPMSPINPEYYKKIEDLLDNCKKRTKPISFVVDKDCPEKYSTYKEYVTENGTTKPIAKVNDYEASPSKHDYLLEFVWKLKSFVHYHCFPEFKEDSVLHDLIQNQLEALFTEDILLRWFNPSMAFRMYDHIFQTNLDLKVTMNNFEKCVRVVHEINKFPVWLKRPIDQPHRAQQSLLSKKRKRRAIDGDGVGLLESEYEDMALGNVRQKRGETKKVSGSSEESSSSTSEEESTTIGSKNKESTANTVGSEETSTTNTLDEMGSTTDENSLKKITQEKVFASGEQTTPSRVSFVGDESAVRIGRSSVIESEGLNKTEKSVEGSESKSSSESRESTTAATKEDEGDDFPSLKASGEMNSIEALYRDSDSKELASKYRPRASDKVWNKFIVTGKKGFVGACIESMSSFTKELHQSMNECW